MILEKYEFDGVHFDYEYPLSLNAWHYYNSFLVSLDKKLGDKITYAAKLAKNGIVIGENEIGAEILQAEVVLRQSIVLTLGEINLQKYLKSY